MGDRSMRCFLIISTAAGLVFSANFGGPSVVLAQTNVVRQAITPEGQVPVAPAVVAAPVAVVEQTVGPAAVVAQAPAEIALAGQVLRTKQVDIRGTNEKVLVALLDTGDGQRQIVDLGPTFNFKVTPIY